MELPEDNRDLSKDNDHPDGLGETPNDQWVVEVVHSRAPDAADRMSRAIDFLLAAAARPRG